MSMVAETLYERLKKLPMKCNSFEVRFVTEDYDEIFDSLIWSVDADEDLRLWRPEDDEWDDASSFTVEELKDLLNGDWNEEEDDDENPQIVCCDSEVFVVDPDWRSDGEPDHTFYSISYRQFKINWKRHLVDVFID